MKREGPLRGRGRDPRREHVRRPLQRGDKAPGIAGARSPRAAAIPRDRGAHSEEAAAKPGQRRTARGDWPTHSARQSGDAGLIWQGQQSPILRLRSLLGVPTNALDRPASLATDRVGESPQTPKNDGKLPVAEPFLRRKAIVWTHRAGRPAGQSHSASGCWIGHRLVRQGRQKGIDEERRRRHSNGYK